MSTFNEAFDQENFEGEAYTKPSTKRVRDLNFYLQKKPMVKEVEFKDGTVGYFREMTSSQRDEFERLAMDFQKGKPVSIRGTLIRMTTCNQDGRLLFGRKQEQALRNMPAEFANEMMDYIFDLNGLNKEEIEKK